ncbi:hypothetical protein C3F09_09640 [candidate division GN15 bacterium]|uniref:DUF4032 domain-containing protein n=1 Tax=candidate division GN15 bacterium TaxID=2072418 RepID=A0A855X3K4_9BACT|nr:MAG: hypothetical protein C3F09_09640 [candidate division GN15 bacterium]
MEITDLEYLCRDFTPAEWQALEVHRYYLSERAGHDVGIVATVEDWLSNHSAKWRQERLQKDLADQASEIMKHKWIESEKAGTDLGDTAVLDWVKKHAGQWRRWREKSS